MTFKITEKDGYFLLTFLKIADRETIVVAYSSLLRHNNFTRESHTLWDMRDAMVDLSISDITKISAAVTQVREQRSEKARSVFLVTDPSDTVILQNYITATAHYPVEFKIFDDYQSGIKWLLD